MTFLLSGKLSAEVAANFVEPLARVAVRFYRPAESGGGEARTGGKAGDEAEASDGGATGAAEEAGGSRRRAVPGKPPNAATLSGEEVAAKEGRWIAQVRAGPDGEFSLDLSRPSILGGAGVEYGGGPVEVDVYWRGITGGQSENEDVGVQFSVGRVQPVWSGDGEVRTAVLELSVPRAAWGQVRAVADAWLVAGRVIGRGTGLPLAGARVFAFDADLVGDDPLGMGVTDADGRFRIDFRGAAFQDAALGGVLEKTGPDLYFRVENAAGGLLIAEPRTRAKESDRRDAANLFTTDLLVDG